MKPLRILALLALTALPAAAQKEQIPATPIQPAPAEAAAQKGDADKPADELEQIQSEFKALSDEFTARIKEAGKDSAKVQEIGKELRAAQLELFAKAEALVKSQRGSELGVRTQVWLAGAHADPSAKAAALQDLLDNHIESPHLAKLVPSLSARMNVAPEEALKALVGKSPHAEVRGAALLMMASNAAASAEDAKALAEGGGRAESVKRRLGNARAAELEQTGVEQLEAQSVALYERVAKEYPDLKDTRGRSYAALAQGAINQARHLLVGKVAPEIQGEDIHGEKFKLSDYRGKVVLLDFWGHW
jgi:hypothetical protein